MNKNTKSQLEYVGDYFKSRPNEEIQTTKANIIHIRKCKWTNDTQIRRKKNN